MIFDSHAHYDDEKFDEDREQLLDSMKGRGIGYIVNVASDFKSCFSTIALTERFPHVFGAIGIHPQEVEELNDEKFSEIKKLALKSKIVAVGEIGLDYYWKDVDEKLQKYWFEKQLDLAREIELPVIIHSREAAEDTMKILKEKHGEDIGGIIHCFSYSTQMAMEYINMNFYIGVGGVVTFKNSRKLKEVVKEVPMDKIVIETDCPYLAPEPNRGKRNSSLNLPYVINEIAEIKGLTPKEVIDITMENAKKVYNMKI